jgi:hypothetical protein
MLRELTELHRQGRIQGIRIVTAPDCCSVCAEVAESLYDPAIAPPLPIIGCAHGWQCRCQYAEEPLPLDARGLESMRRLERMERERELRRRGVPIGGPRWLHLLVIAVSLAAVALTFVLAKSDLAVGSSALTIGIVAVLLCAVVAVFALRRQRPLPSPTGTYLLVGLFILVVAFWPLLGLKLPAGLTLQHLNRLQQTSLTPRLSTAALAPLLQPREVLAAAGLTLLLLGALGTGMDPENGRQARMGPSSSAGLSSQKRKRGY